MPHFTVEDVLDENATFEPAALAAVKALARAKPWQGSDGERLAKFNACAAALSTAYQLPVWTIAIGELSIDGERRVATFSKLSVVTFLNFMGAVRGLDEFRRYRWSVNLFRRCFPRSFARCSQDGAFLRMPE